MDRFFDGESEALPVKRWRCADCAAVHTMRPETHWRGFWAAWPVILASLLAKANGQRWQRATERQRQQYWWRGYRIQSRIEGAAMGPWELLLAGRIVATHSLSHREIRWIGGATNRIFAVTAPSGIP